MNTKKNNEELRDISNKGKSWEDEELKIILSDAPTKENCLKYAKLFKRGHGSKEQIYIWTTRPNKNIPENRKKYAFIRQVKTVAQEIGFIG